jgi:hypothetical protein
VTSHPSRGKRTSLRLMITQTDGLDTMLSEKFWKFNAVLSDMKETPSFNGLRAKSEYEGPS